MKLLYFVRKKYSYIFIMCFVGLYLLFPSVNPVGDAYSNAYSSLWGEEMFRPHHLLYCFYGRVLLQIFGWVGIEPLVLLQYANALVAGGCLLVLRRMIKRVNADEVFLSAAIAFGGSCFGFMRFATDNECYVLPLLFCLLAMYYMQVFLVRNSLGRVVKAAVCISLACLFHQLSILVWLCLFMVFLFDRHKKHLLIFLSISLSVPLLYLLTTYGMNGELSLSGTLEFALHDYLSGEAGMPVLKQLVMLTAVGLLRSFVQLHGYVFGLFASYTAICISISVIVFVFAVLGIAALRNIKRRKLKLFQERRFVRMLWGVLLLTIAFAAFSNGNAEFMVIIPFITIMLYVYYFESSRPVIWLSAALLVWNISFALYPNNAFHFEPDEELAELTKQYPDAVFVLTNKPMVENICLYKFGKVNSQDLLHAQKYTKQQYLKDKKENKIIITDVPNAVNALSRAELTEKVVYRFEDITDKELLFGFESPKCKRRVYKL